MSTRYTFLDVSNLLTIDMYTILILIHYINHYIINFPEAFRIFGEYGQYTLYQLLNRLCDILTHETAVMVCDVI